MAMTDNKLSQVIHELAFEQIMLCESKRYYPKDCPVYKCEYILNTTFNQALLLKYCGHVLKEVGSV